MASEMLHREWGLFRIRGGNIALSGLPEIIDKILNSILIQNNTISHKSFNSINNNLPDILLAAFLAIAKLCIVYNTVILFYF